MLILLRNCFLVDGTGAPGRQSDILIQDKVISDIGSFSNVRADRVFDLAGLTVTPGFIDVNADSDHYFTLFSDPGQKSLVAQGVTSIVGGNSGTSLAPLFGDGILSLRKWADPNQININWGSFGEFISWLNTRKFGINFGSLVGHSTIRRGLMGDSLIPLDKNEYKKFIYLIGQSLKEGAFGFSTGLAYSRASHVSNEELFELTKSIAHRKGVYGCYPKGEQGIEQGIKELVFLAKENDLNTEITHLATPGSDDFRRGLEQIEEASHEISINFDLSPYHISVKPLFTLLPTWATQRGFDQLLRYLTTSDTRARILNDIDSGQKEIGTIVISYAKNQWIVHGKSIEEVALNQNLSVAETLLKILQISENQVGGFIVDSDEVLHDELLFHPLSSISSHGVGYDRVGTLNRPKIHPRSFGAFPRFLRMVREKGKISFEEAIKKITGAVAEKYGFIKRGVIEVGNNADLVILDPIEVGEKSTFENPAHYSTGITMVFVNGVLSYERGNFINSTSGEIIKPSSH